MSSKPRERTFGTGDRRAHRFVRFHRGGWCSVDAGRRVKTGTFTAGVWSNRARRAETDRVMRSLSELLSMREARFIVSACTGQVSGFWAQERPCERQSGPSRASQQRVFAARGANERAHDGAGVEAHPDVNGSLRRTQRPRSAGAGEPSATHRRQTADQPRDCPEGTVSGTMPSSLFYQGAFGPSARLQGVLLVHLRLVCHPHRLQRKLCDAQRVVRLRHRNAGSSYEAVSYGLHL